MNGQPAGGGKWLLLLFMLCLLCSGCVQKHVDFAEPPSAPDKASDLTPGAVQKRRLQGDAAMEYYIYVPRKGGDGAKLFVTVHGVSRDADLHAEKFASLAEQYGVVLIAPVFSSKRFPGYQQLGNKEQGNRADQALMKIAAEAGQLSGAQSDRLYLFGFSGGGQFVHRFAMAFPERVAKLSVGSAGWYTFPDPKLPYPQGIQSVPDLPGVQFDANAFLKIPTLVTVGERDTTRNDPLEKDPEIDAQQGLTRVERGKRWAQAMKEAANAEGITADYRFQTVPNAGHNFENCMDKGGMGKSVFEFLFGTAPV
ncbi:alpha/beta hydrolase family protein [Paenibacillus allorhizosphaerae]|uniref:Alpha/beta hydrolase n=1 Tax=Paenibacillus allorhizosphaerae TaxID=2849866 RepID=A0ABM8VIT3_9BACL|nr:PHB depolymerase family esterase [Paenibacillus allorhizosphaerae]CAG7644534.1 hypothetical protein PAECIP111802_03300 [Paenibacillus allorhizosphaerae]